MAEEMLETEGFNELISNLEKLGKKETNKIIRKSLRKAAKEAVLPAVKSRVPVDSGKLKKAIVIRGMPRSRKRIGILVKIKSREAVGLSETSKGYYPAVIEYGTKKRAAKSYMRTGIAASRARAIKIIGSTMKILMLEAMRK